MSGNNSHSANGSKATELVGRAVEDLNLNERWKFTNEWVAFRIYAPPGKVTRDGVEFVDVRQRKIEAAGKSIEECVAQLRSRNLDPAQYEFTVLKPPY
jgi:hypothetical protein